MSLRAIVFDFDGVIANSEPLHFRAYRDVLAGHHVALTEHDYYARYLGFDDIGAFEAIAADRALAWTRADVAALVARKALRLEELERDVSVLFPGAADAVRRAAAAMPIAIASGARGDEIMRVLRREHLASCFTAIVAAEDTPVSKPAPDPYLRALTLLHTAAGGMLVARDCVAIEDSRWGLRSARAAGMRTVAVTNTYEKSALTDEADLVIPSLEAMDLDALARLCPES
jgi:HAD superfamily hydrolase (TIGR01509 family)